MLFNSLSFIASFAVLAFAYYALPHRARWILLCLASLGFYATFNPGYVALLLALTAATYAAGLRIGQADAGRRSTAIFCAAVAVVLGTLFIVKYFDFVVGSIEAAGRALGSGSMALPRMNLVNVAGLSFYSFSCVSYLADVRSGKMAPERHFGYFTLYVAFFPKLLAGPIERARPFLTRLRQPVIFNDAQVTLGLQQFLWGLFKKVVIADRLATFVDAAYRQPTFAPLPDLLIATYFFAFQLYCDFSGYSDMAIGASRVLGFDLMENFRRPYLALSVRDFWTQRWHLSLTSWFRDYVYIPLGGNRVSRVHQALNIMAVFLLSGLWHGANWTFVVWGGLNGLYQTISLFTTSLRGRVTAAVRVPSILRALVTFHLILITWVFFRAASLSDAVTIFTRLWQGAARLPALVIARLSASEIQVSLALILLLLGVEVVDEKRSIWSRLDAAPLPLRWASYYALIFALVTLGVWNFKQFVYMQF